MVRITKTGNQFVVHDSKYGNPIELWRFTRVRALSLALAGKRLPRISRKDIEFGETECSICRDSFEQKRHLTKGPCGHTFHMACINEYVLKRFTDGRDVDCPVCRATWCQSELCREKIAAEIPQNFFGDSKLSPRINT